MSTPRHSFHIDANGSIFLQPTQFKFSDDAVEYNRMQAGVDAGYQLTLNNDLDLGLGVRYRYNSFTNPKKDKTIPTDLHAHEIGGYLSAAYRFTSGFGLGLNVGVTNMMLGGTAYVGGPFPYEFSDGENFWSATASLSAIAYFDPLVISVGANLSLPLSHVLAAGSSAGEPATPLKTEMAAGVALSIGVNLP